MNQGLTIYEKESGDTLLSLQVHQKRPGCPTCDNTFISLNNYTHPFIFTRTASANDITSFKILDSDDNVVETLSTGLVKILNAGAVDYIYCNFQSLGLATALDCGLYYYEILCSTESYYSEIFTVISNDLHTTTEDIAVNGQFTTDLSSWTASGATWISAGGGRAQLDYTNSIAQAAPGESLVEVVVNIISANSGSYFEFGGFSFLMVTGDNTYYVPSGVTYTIINRDTATFDTFYVESVEIYALFKIDCLNLIIARNSCNKNGIPYVATGYCDVFILDAELSEPEYKRDDEDALNGDKSKTLTFMRIDKRWNLSTTPNIYEPYVDELNKLPANDTLYIHNDVWGKTFSVYQATIDIEIPQPEWEFENKCNASVNIIITENLAINNSCCEDIADITCCTEFGYTLEETAADVWLITLDAPFCGAGVIYSILTIDTGTQEILGEEIFTDAIEVNIAIASGEEYSLKGSKFGCSDVIYSLNLS